jgi:hypothetical protein
MAYLLATLVFLISGDHRHHQGSTRTRFPVDQPSGHEC